MIAFGSEIDAAGDDVVTSGGTFVINADGSGLRRLSATMSSVSWQTGSER
jgi:hypothetical protein